MWGGAILLLLGLVLRVYRRSALTTLTILIGSIGGFVFGMEFFVDRWLHQLWSPSWALVVDFMFQMISFFPSAWEIASASMVLPVPG